MALTPAEKQRQYRDRKRGLEAARELGRRYGEDEVARLALSSHPDPDPKARIQRAIRYAEWNFQENGRIA